jgi:hypothetical protein
MPLAPIRCMESPLLPNGMRCGGESPPHLTSSMKLTLALSALLCAVLAIGCGQGQEPTQPTPTGNGGLSTALATFSVLQSPAERLPRPLRLHLGRILGHYLHSQFHPTSVQRVRSANGIMWTFVDGAAVCVAQGGRGSVACSQAGRAESEGVSLGVFTPPSERVPWPHDFLMVGLVPNQIDQVLVTIGRRQRTIAVHSNMFSASGGSPVLIKRLIRK